MALSGLSTATFAILEQLKLRRNQVDFFRNVVVASRTKGKRNREIPMDVLDERVKPILFKLCENKKPDEFVFVNLKTKKPYTDVKKAFATACDKAELRISNGMTLEPPFALG